MTCATTLAESNLAKLRTPDDFIKASISISAAKVQLLSQKYNFFIKKIIILAWIFGQLKKKQ
jgi:hypothetical protein